MNKRQKLLFTAFLLVIGFSVQTFTFAAGASKDKPTDMPKDKPNGAPGGFGEPGGSGGPGGFGGSGTVTNGTSATTLNSDATINNTSYSSTGDDENALRVDAAKITFDKITVEKTSGESSNTEDGDFYGQNAAFLALNGSTVTITNSKFSSSAINGNGVFAYGSGTTINIADSVIRTTERNSGGIQTTGGAIMNATNLDIVTQGNSAAAIRSDRGGGIVNVNGGTYTTNGTGSPAIYSTATITVKDAVLTANNSECVVVEGKNSVNLINCSTIGNWKSSQGSSSSESTRNIMIYQSMSGDAEVGHSSFSAENGSITSKNGDMFYVTNTSCTINLANVKLNMDTDVLIRAEGNNSERGWGKTGANGGKVVFTTSSQILEGQIIVDSISTMDASFTSGTTFKGCINKSGQAGTVNVTLDSSSKWTLTSDSYITSFTGNLDNVVAGTYHLYAEGKLLK